MTQSNVIHEVNQLTQPTVAIYSHAFQEVHEFTPGPPTSLNAHHGYLQLQRSRVPVCEHSDRVSGRTTMCHLFGARL